jgi:hypothetical protein
MPNVKYHIKIEQLDSKGNVFRTFTHVAYSRDGLDKQLARITNAYNLEATRVIVNGKEIKKI